MKLVKELLCKAFIHLYAGIFWLKNEGKRRDAAEYGVMLLLLYPLALPGAFLMFSLFDDTRSGYFKLIFMGYGLVCIIVAYAVTWWATWHLTTGPVRPLPKGSRSIGLVLVFTGLLGVFPSAFIILVLLGRITLW